VTVEGSEYQAACRIVQRHPRGPSRWRPGTRKYLRPRAEWPWPDHEVLLWVVALWWKDARPAVERQLRRLLGDRHRYPNIRFVVELLRRDLVPGNDLRAEAVDALRRELTAVQPDDERWTVMVDSLFRLNTEQAVEKLEDLVRFADPTVTAHRRLTAVDRVTDHDPGRGAKSLAVLANNLTGAPRERLGVALRIGERDRELGTKAMRLLAHTPDMRELRVDAAIHTGDTTLWRDMVASWRDLSDSGRLRVGARLLEMDPTTAVAALEELADTAAQEETPVLAAATIRHRDPDTALRIAVRSAWPADHEVGSGVRLDAIHLIGEIEPARALPELEKFADDPTASGENRFFAAARVIELGGPLTTMVRLAEDDRLTRTYRVEAARTVATSEPTAAAPLFIAIANTAPDLERLTLLKEAGTYDHQAAAEELAGLAEMTAKPGPIRIKAVEVAAQALGSTRTIQLYTKIATTTGDQSALDAARKVKAMDPAAGQRLMADLARQPGKSASFRLAAAKAAGTRATRVLEEFVDNARQASVRFEAAQALHDVDPAAGVKAYQKLVKKLRRDEYRVKAALALPNKQAVQALLHIVQDSGEQERICFDAGLAAMKKAPRLGREALQALAERPGISPRTLEQIRKRLR
jgi:hypothetical protein